MPDEYAKEEPTVAPQTTIQLKFNDIGKKVFSRYITDIREETLTVVRETDYSYWVTTPKINGNFGVLKTQVAVISSAVPAPVAPPEEPLKTEEAPLIVEEVPTVEDLPIVVVEEVQPVVV